MFGIVAAGTGNGTIANELRFSLETVRNHVSSIVTNLQVSDRSDGRMVGVRIC